MWIAIMVMSDYHMVMTKHRTVGVAELKARLSEYLRSVRRGGDVVIHDRSEPIARLVPYAAGDARLIVREPAGRYAAVGRIPLPRPLKLDVDVVQVLLAERRSGR
jgi:prevent-host-death family protein